MRMLPMLVWLLVAFAGVAAAQSESLLHVTRAAGAEDCPDGAALLERIEGLRRPPKMAQSAGYEVSFARDGQGLSATLATRADPAGTRELRDAGPTCDALAQATAVTLALLLDSESETASTQLQPAPVAATPVAVVIAKREAEERAPVPTQVSIALGGFGVIGVVRSFTPSASLELGLRRSRLQLLAGVLFAPGTAVELGPGRVHESLLSSSLLGCVVPWSSAAAQLQACTGIYAGSLRASSEHFTRDAHASALWLALPLSLGIETAARPIGVQLRVSALLALKRADFVVDGLDASYESLPIGVLITLAGVVAWPL